jgi:hypothetical protein
MISIRQQMLALLPQMHPVSTPDHPVQGTHSKPKGRAYGSFSDTTIDGYNLQRMGYEFDSYCIPEWVLAGPWKHHRITVRKSCPATWSRINRFGDKVYKQRACTFGQSAQHSRLGDDYKGMELSNLYASKLMVADTFRELIKELPSPKGQRLDQKYKKSLQRVHLVWEPKQKEKSDV